MAQEATLLPSSNPFIRALKKYKLQIFLSLPLFAYILGFTFLPVLYTLYMSFRAPSRYFFSLDNYRQLFAQPEFKIALFNTAFITGVGLTLEIIIGLVLALCLKQRSRLRGFFRTIFILPLGIPTVVAATNMSFIFSTNGWLNEILYDLRLIKDSINWMGGGFLSLMMVVFADMWKVTPLVMLILLAGLESIDEELYKAARVDRASSWQIFRHITLPLLKPAITMAVIIRGIDAFRIFALPMILMGQHLKVVGTYAYLEYAEYNNPYLSSASSCVLLFMILICIIFYLKVAGREAVTE